MSAQARFIVKNAVRMVTLLFAVSVISFALANLAPIDPVSAYAGSENHLSQEQLDAIAAHWGFDQPPVTRYFNWIGGVLAGDWGVSVMYQRPVLDVIAERALTSLALMGTAWVLSGVLGFALGVLCGMRQGTWTDRLVKGFCLVLSAAAHVLAGASGARVLLGAAGMVPHGARCAIRRGGVRGHAAGQRCGICSCRRSCCR